jgi:guanine deaminase
MIHSPKFGTLEVIPDGLLLIDSSGSISELINLDNISDPKTEINKVDPTILKILKPNEIIMPGFIDCHAHAPQYSFIGTGMNLPLLEWLNKYTFPNEAKFKDTAYARKVYEKAVRRGLCCGTTTCSWFATLHLEASKILVDVVREQGQRAHVGKVSMDRNSPEDYVESTAQGLKDVKAFVEYVKETDKSTQPIVTPSIIPRFVPSCTSEMMNGLSEISSSASDNPNVRLPVHSHLSESKPEQAWVKDLHPESDNYAQVYADHGLLHEGAYMAHCVHCCDVEVEVLNTHKTGVVHCPSSNFMLKSGVLNVRKMLEKDVKMGLGSDVCGGYALSVLDCMRQAVIASRTAAFSDPTTEPITMTEAFYLATKGGANVLSLGNVCGDLTAGKKCDILVVDTSSTPLDLIGFENLEERFEKFLFVGDDRNIKEVYVDGKLVISNDSIDEPSTSHTIKKTKLAAEEE